MTSDTHPAATARLPTLTEVVELGLEEGGAAAPAAQAQAAALAAPLIDEAALVLRVCEQIEQRIDILFEAHLREALAPALARAADGLIGAARQDLARAVRELAADAVARTLRPGQPP